MLVTTYSTAVLVVTQTHSVLTCSSIARMAMVLPSRLERSHVEKTLPSILPLASAAGASSTTAAVLVVLVWLVSSRGADDRTAAMWRGRLPPPAASSASSPLLSREWWLSVSLPM